MKLDMDFVRTILITLEDNKYDGAAVRMDPPFDGHTPEESRYHLLRMIEAGLVDGNAKGPLPIVKGLTWDGHQYLNKIRDDGIWQTVKNRALSTTGALAFEVVTALAGQEIKRRLGIG